MEARPAKIGAELLAKLRTSCLSPGLNPQRAGRAAAFHLIRQPLDTQVSRGEQAAAGASLSPAPKALLTEGVYHTISAMGCVCDLASFMVLEKKKKTVHHKSRKTELYGGEKCWVDLPDTYCKTRM